MPNTQTTVEAADQLPEWPSGYFGEVLGGWEGELTRPEALELEVRDSPDWPEEPCADERKALPGTAELKRRAG